MQMEPIMKSTLLIKRFIVHFLLFLIPIMTAGSLSCDKPTDPEEPSGYTYTVPSDLNDGIQTGSLTGAGLETGPIISLMQTLLSSTDHLYHGLLIAKDGKLVLEEYFSGEDIDIFQSGLPGTQTNFNATTLHYQASVTKSVSSILMGIAMDMDLVNSVDDTIFTYFPEHNDLAVGGKGAITLKMMLGMCSGLPWDESTYPHDDTRSDHYKMLFSNDPVRNILEKPLITTPGTAFLYNSGTTNVFADVIRKKSGLLLAAFAEQTLFNALGITQYRWMRCPGDDNVTFASGGLYLTPRDMMKIGLLFARDGVWNGSRVVNEAWVDESTTTVIPWPAKTSRTSAVRGYGYQWWLDQYDSGAHQAYSARGWGGQFIIVFPDIDMVVVMTAGGYFENNPIAFYDILQNYILEALE